MAETIAGLPVAIFFVAVGFGICGGLIICIFPYIFCKRYCVKRNKLMQIEYEERKRNKNKKKKKKRGFFGRGGRDSNGGWVQRIDPESNQPYYENLETGEVSWTDPTITSHIDPNTGAPYYMNTQTGHVSWNMGSVAQGPGPAQGQMVPQGYPQQPPAGRGAPPQGYPQQGLPNPGFAPPQQQQQQMPRGGPPPMQQQQMPPQQQQQQQQQQMPPAAPASRNTVAARGGPPPGLQQAATPAAAPAAAAGGKNDPKYAKYLRMEKAGLPEGAIRNAMGRDGVSSGDVDAFFKG